MPKYVGFHAKENDLEVGKNTCYPSPITRYFEKHSLEIKMNFAILSNSC